MPWHVRLGNTCQFEPSKMMLTCHGMSLQVDETPVLLRHRASSEAGLIENDIFVVILRKDLYHVQYGQH